MTIIVWFESVYFLPIRGYSTRWIRESSITEGVVHYYWSFARKIFHIWESERAHSGEKKFIGWVCGCLFSGANDSLAACRPMRYSATIIAYDLTFFYFLNNLVWFRSYFRSICKFFKIFYWPTVVFWVPVYKLRQEYVLRSFWNEAQAFCIRKPRFWDLVDRGLNLWKHWWNVVWNTQFYY